MAIRVVLGDDNVLVREGVRALLSATDGIDVVGVAEDAPSLLTAVDEHRPDVVVTDIKMPPNFRLEGIEAAHTIRQRHPGTGAVVLSAHDDDAYALALLERLAGEAGRGAAAAVDELKRLHAAVVDRETSTRTLRSFVPSQFAERLATAGLDATQQVELEATILFSDIRGFSSMAEDLPA